MRACLILAAIGLGLGTAQAQAQGCSGRFCSLSVTNSVSPIIPYDAVLAGFSKYGQFFAFNAATNVFPVGNGGVAQVTSTFGFNTGQGSTFDVYAKEDGIVSFGGAVPSGAFAPVANLSAFGLPVIAPFYADLNQNSRTAIGAGVAGVVIQQGIAAPFADTAGAYSIANAKSALQITWYGFDVGTGPTVAAPPSVFSQLLLIDEGGGDFDVKIRAGAPGSASANSPGGGIGGFALNGDEYRFTTPYSAATNGDFAVRNGEVELLNGAVPEPAAWASTVLGVGLAGAAMRRRRKPGRAHAAA